MRQLARTLMLALGVWSSVAGGAAAFSDYELFPADPLFGGGGGRFFTGSPVDGFGCSVCHRGGPEPQVLFRGLPAVEYVPGTSYDVQVVWSNPQSPHALALEFTNQSGQAAGQLTPLEPVDASELCTGEASAEPPTHLSQASGRAILTLDDCGAASLRFRFTAPADPRVIFAASVVRSDVSETPEGDGVLEIRQVLMRQGTRAGPTTSACSAAPPSRNSSRAGASLTLLCALVVGALCNRRSRAQRRSKLSRTVPSRASTLRRPTKARYT